MSSKVADAKAEMKEYLKSRRKKKGESCIIYKPITITFEFTDDDLRRGQTDKTLLAGGADTLATATNTSKASSADVVTARQ